MNAKFHWHYISVWSIKSNTTVPKLGVGRTLHQRPDVVTSEDNDLKSETGHVNRSMKRCSYSGWASINKVTQRLLEAKRRKERC